MNYQLFQIKLKYDALNQEIDEISKRIKERNLKIDKDMAEFTKSQTNQSTQQQGTSTQPVVGDSQPETPPLTTAEIYAIAQNPQKWSQFLAARKPELMEVWGRRSA
jgi:hypothetical protein